MTLRQVFILVVRSIGIWAGVRAITRIPVAVLSILGVLLNLRPPHGDAAGSVWTTLLGFGLPPVFELAVAIVLLLGSTRIANWFYPKPGNADSAKSLAIAPEAAYRTAARLLGVYAILWSIRPLSRALTLIIDHPGQLSLRPGEGEVYLEAMLYLGLAFVLLVGSRRIGVRFSEQRVSSD